MCEIWLELGANRIPMTRKELSAMQVSIRHRPSLLGIAQDIQEYLNPPESIPTNKTLVQLAAIASTVQRCPVPDKGVDGIAEAMQDIGAALVEAATHWHEQAGYAGEHWQTVIASREQLRHWAGLLRGNDDDLYADDVESLMNRISLLLPDLR